MTLRVTPASLKSASSLLLLITNYCPLVVSCPSALSFLTEAIWAGGNLSRRQVGQEASSWAGGS